MFRQDISTSGLYNIVQRAFLKIRDIRQARKSSVSLKDALLSALAVFSFKWPSLLSFEIDIQHDEVMPEMCVGFFTSTAFRATQQCGK